MTINLFAVSSRARYIPPVAAVVVAALVITAPTANAANTRPTPVLGEGAGMGLRPDPQVRVLQRALEHHGYDVGAPGIDGRFGPLTAAAVRRMQANHRLAVDGIVGDHTRTALGLPRVSGAHARFRSHAEQGSQAQRLHAETPTQRTAPRPAAPVAPAATTSKESETDGSRPDWFGLVLAAVVVIAILSVPAGIGFKRGRRAGQARSRPVPGRAHAGSHAAPVAPVAARKPPFRLGDSTLEAASPTGTRVSSPDSGSGAADEGDSALGLPSGTAVIGYVTLPADPGFGEVDSSSDVIGACERFGWKLLEVVRDRENVRVLERPGLGYALRRIADGEAQGIVVSDLRCLSHSIIDLGELVKWFGDAGAALIALDLGIDTSTPDGRQMAAMLMTLGSWERERIANRTRNGLAEVRANGGRIGRPAVSDQPDLVQRIESMRAANLTLQAIADQLNAEGVPTLRGGRKWRPSSIQAAVGYRRPNPRDHLPLPDRRPAQ